MIGYRYSSRFGGRSGAVFEVEERQIDLDGIVPDGWAFRLSPRFEVDHPEFVEFFQILMDLPHISLDEASRFSDAFGALAGNRPE